MTHMERIQPLSRIGRDRDGAPETSVHGIVAEEPRHRSLREAEASPQISVVVLNWNGAACIDKCLQSLERQTYRDFEIVVVDNSSTDGSGEHIATAWKGRVTLVLLDKNQGYCGGNNRGLEVARGSLIIFLNNDAEADPLWLEEIAAAAARHPRAGMFASRVYSAIERNRFDSVGLLVYPDGVCRSRGWLEVDRGQYDTEEEVLGPNGAAAVYRRSMLAETGGFDERYFLYLEDLDLAMRGWLMGYTCIYVPAAIVYHIKSLNSGHHSKLKAFYVERNRLWNLVKLFPPGLVLASPAFTLYRYFLQTFAAFTNRGASGGFVRNYSKFELAVVLTRALASAIAGLPYVRRQAREIREKRRLSQPDFYRVISRFKLSALDLALKD